MNTTQQSFVYDCIQQFGSGDVISYAHLQPQLERFQTSYGLWSYRTFGDITITLGGPLCSPVNRQDMLRKFLQDKKKPILFYLTEDFLTSVKEYPLHNVCIGTNRRIKTKVFLQQPSSKVKGALKKAKKAGVIWKEVFHMEQWQSSLTSISEEYLTNAQYEHEMSFINMPLQCGLATYRRLFLMKEGSGRILGFVYLNPIYTDGQLVGYLLDMLRFIKTKIWGLWFSTVYTLAQVLHREGLELYLGFCPLHDLQVPKNNHSRILNIQMSMLSKNFQSIQYIKNLREMKEEIEGYNSPRFMSSYTRNLPTCVAAFMKAMDIDPTKTNPDSILTRTIWNMLMMGKKS